MLRKILFFFFGSMFKEYEARKETERNRKTALVKQCMNAYEKGRSDEKRYSKLNV